MSGVAERALSLLILGAFGYFIWSKLKGKDLFRNVRERMGGGGDDDIGDVGMLRKGKL